MKNKPLTCLLRQAQDGAGRTDWKGVLRQHLFPFVLSLSKYERTLRLSRPCSSNRFSILTLRQASFDRLRTGRANGLKNEPLTCLLRQAQDGAGRTDWKGVLRQHLSPFVLSLSK
ncbi:MAG: hypothetical protein LBD67_05025 [Candidatus Accumulibacter sp.]|nr:hypothetical protein [Accumulibacter sp.]